ncbi:MAG: hypothetical protein II942_04600 [Alphaproteobacteria bacterium]|nr:hypothetical protein [Alphaproteobacteria bacterium]
MVVEIKSASKNMPVKEIRVLRQSKGWRILLEEGINNKGQRYKTRLDFYNGTLRQKLCWANNELRKIVFISGRPDRVLYERTYKMTPNGRQVIEQGWTGKHGYFSLKSNDHTFAHFGNFLVEEWNNTAGRVREVKIDKKGEYVLEKRTLKKSKDAVPEILDENPARKNARRSMAVVAARPDLSPKQKWAKVREVVARYRAKQQG